MLKIIHGRRRFLSSVLALALVTVPVFGAPHQQPHRPSPISTPFEFSLPELGVQFLIEPVAGGYHFADPNRPEIHGFVPESRVRSASVLELASERGGETRALLLLEDGLGAPITYELRGRDQGDTFTGELMIPGQRGAEELVIRFLEASPTRQPGAMESITGEFAVVVKIVITAAVVGAIGCTLAALAQNCGETCAGACGPTGVAGFEEGLCGTCTCVCG